MPEGDTVYLAARKLDRALTGQVLTSSDFRIPSLATSDISGATVSGTISRGKHLLTRFDNGLTLRTHLKMEGTWQVDRYGMRWRRPAHTARVILRTASMEAVGFQVILDLVRTDEEEDLVGHLGPDLLGPDWDAEVALAR
ncbi:MAG: glycosylase, partial [Marmoricola sp.]|nr:glycosylase [Marmoricola sp.]